MGLYVEGDVPFVANGNCNGNNGGWNSGWEWIVALALIGGFGRNGGLFGNGGGAGGDFAGWQLGRLATTNDVASGFSTSEIMSDLNSIILAQAQGFAGLNTAIANATSTLGFNMAEGFHGVDNAICTLGYQTQAGFNALGTQLADCLTSSFKSRLKKVA